VFLNWIPAFAGMTASEINIERCWRHYTTGFRLLVRKLEFPEEGNVSSKFIGWKVGGRRNNLPSTFHLPHSNFYLIVSNFFLAISA
jgi:hypothetical protein